MVAGFQDELDSEDEVMATKTSGQSVTKFAIAQDIDLSSDDDGETSHSKTHVVKYNEDYDSSDQEEKHKGDNVASAKLTVSDNGLKLKSNSVSSGSDNGEITGKNEVVSAIISEKIVSSASAHSSDTPVLDNDSDSSNVSKSKQKSDSKIKQLRKHSTDSDTSGHMTNSASGIKAEHKLTNQNSDSESDTGCQVTVLQDTDINPDDFGGEDVFNDWLNKQEKVCMN